MPRPIQPKLNKDHWGFYKVGDYKTYSRLDAIEVSAKTHQRIAWNFNDEAFSQFDWTREPPGELNFWYRQRAEQLREHYDYLILWYSSGYDSDAILRAFVDNDIFIDEVVHVGFFEGSNHNKNDPANYETYVSGYPTIKSLIDTNPTYKNTKQTLIDMTKHECHLMDTSETEDWFYRAVIGTSPSWFLFSTLSSWDKDIATAHSKYSRVGQIVGIEKPKVWAYENGDADVVFSQVPALGIINAYDQKDNNQWQNLEQFYWTPDMPEIVCKQGHIVKRYLEKLGSHQLDKDHEIKPVDYFKLSPTVTHSGLFKNNNFYTINDEVIANLVYPHKRINFGTKPSSFFFAIRDNWLWDSQTPDIGQKNYIKGLNWFKQTVLKNRPDLWWDSRMSKATIHKPYSGGIACHKTLYSLTQKNLVKKELK